MTHPLHSQERVDWQTPPEPLDRTRRIGPIVLDPCTSYRNPTGALIFCSPQSPSDPAVQALAQAEGRVVAPPGLWLGRNGLALDLPTVGLSFWNPPYGPHLGGAIDPFREVWREKDGARILMGIGTGWAAKWAAHAGAKVALVPNRTETEWWGLMFDNADALCFPDHRIAFIDPDTGKPGLQPNHGSTIFFSTCHDGPGVRQFADAFEGFGRLLRGGRK